MASVLKPCGKKHGDATHRSTESGRQRRRSEVYETDNYILNMLNQLPPTKELLKHYQEKLEQYEKEEKFLLDRIAECSKLLDSSNRLEQELGLKCSLVEMLRRELEEVGTELRAEQARSRQLAADNQRLRQASDIHKVRQPQGEKCAAQLELENRFLEQQILTQEKFNKEQLLREKEKRRAMEQEGEANSLQIIQLQRTLRNLEAQLTQLSSKMVEERSHHRRLEKEWLLERTALSRKVQLLDRVGLTRLQPGEQHAEQRLQTRLSEEKILRKEVERLIKLAEEKDQLITKLRSEVADVLSENDALRDQVQSIGESLARRTKSMTEQSAAQAQRYDKLMKRCAREAEGYTYDIRNLRTKLEKLEERLIAITRTKALEEENLQMLDELRRELKEVEKRKPKEWKTS